MTPPFPFGAHEPHAVVYAVRYLLYNIGPSPTDEVTISLLSSVETINS